MNGLQERILSLKKEKDTLIMAHYYQPLEIQDIADVVGDSFALAKLAQDARQQNIILCGVSFMAESAKILNPDKNVFLPAKSAGCPMADMITPEDVLTLRREHPGAAVVCYVNSSAAVKAVSDICCTSSSAEKIVASLPEKQIIFIPDKNLGTYIAKQFPEKEFFFFDGHCPVHNALSEADITTAKQENPNAMVLAHPECPMPVLKHADYIGSTAGILDQARKSGDSDLIIATECGVSEILSRELPEKKIVSAKSDFVCEDMKKTTLQDILDCLEGRTAPIEMSEKEIQAAAKSLERMVNAG